MKKILHIVGNRPQFVKLAVLYKELERSGEVEQAIIHTGQHFSYEMNGLFFKELAIPEPGINFNLQGNSPNHFIGTAADALQEYFAKEKNAAALVYGDTNTTLAAAIAAKRKNIPLLHFEAGVRTGDNSMPEEINRLLTDRLADINYCCTQKNLDTLLSEGYGSSIPSSPVLTGDLMLDAFLQVPAGKVDFDLPQNFILCTIHRAANLQQREPLENIIEGLNALHQATPVIMPVHPHTQKKIREYNLRPAFITIPPIGYPQMKTLLQECDSVITDSGGASREAYFSGRRSLIIMDKPFWPEIIEAGCALRANADAVAIRENFSKLSMLSPVFNNSLFGNGEAAKNIHRHLLKYFYK